MHGNVEELCDDVIRRARVVQRATRGGNWNSGADRCQVTSPFATDSSHTWNGLGLRLARVPAAKEGP
jgi:formylglycine-generating enzyme required for sulfatase activity